MRTLTILAFLVLAACAKSQEDVSPTAPPSAAPEPQSVTKKYCGDIIVITYGFVFKTAPPSYEVFQLSDGIYGHNQSRNGWGIVTEACHYQVSGDEVDLL